MRTIFTGSAGFYRKSKKEIQERISIPEPAAVKAMKEFMKEHFRENLTLDTIAESAFLSASYASRLFKKQMNVSIMDYLLQLRMSEAKKMLRETNFSIDDISSRTGYADSSYFTKVFRKAMGMTPSQYRQSLKAR